MSSLVELKAKLESAAANNDQQRVLDLLRLIGKTQISKGILKATKIGFTVAKLRKRFEQGSQIHKAATAMIRKWKSALKGGKGPTASHKPSQLARNASASPNPTAGPPGAKGPSSSSVSRRPTHMSNPVQNKDAIASKRQKMRKLFARDLVSLDPTWAEEFPNYVQTANSIETAIYQTSKKEPLSQRDKYYIRKIREIIQALKSKATPQLNRNLLSGQINPEDVPSLTPDDLMSQKQLEDKKQRLHTFTQDKRSDLKTAASGTLTEEYKCNKCGNRKCKYTQAQTRGADEPMTVFIRCLKCGAKWRD